MSQSQTGTQEFSKWRAFLWPVHRHELKKLIPMLLIFFLISFDQNVLRSLKDTLVITAKSSGAEVIPFIKVWVLLPGAFLFTYIFTRLSNRLVRERVFYVMIGIFLVYFFLFTFVVYPMRDTLHPNALADSLQETLPLGFKGMIAMFRNWTFTSFYVMSELWSNIILSMLFWGFANQVTRIGEAKRFYGLFGIGANLSGVAAGQASVFLCNNNYNPYMFGNDAWEQSFNLIMILVLFSGIITIFLFRWMHTDVLSNPLFYDADDDKQDDKKSGPQKLSMRASFAYLLKSKYLTSIALIVISYNVVINLVEVVWKHQVKEMYPNPTDYNWYMGQVTTLIGILATLTSLFVAGNSVRKFGWTFTALLTPIVLCITSIGFFGFFFLKPYLSDNTYLAFLGASPLAIVVFFGSAQNLLSRAAKYTVFDATKEMAFVPLSPESKLKGKAVIDGVCSRLGKSGGSVIHQSLLLAFATITASAPYVAGSLFAIIALWAGATKVLGAQFNELTQGPGQDPMLATNRDSSPVILEGELQEQKAT